MVPIGVHLTAVREHANYCWAPMASPEKVPSVVAEGWYYWRYEQIDEFIEQVSAEQLELEFRTQIEALLETDLDFLMSDEPRRIIEEKGIILLDYRPLQKAWREINCR